MLKKSFIQFIRYEGLDIYENLLLGLIVGLTHNGKKPCFSNEYAANRIGVSTRKVSSIITNFKERGLITTYYDGRKRFIYLKELPNILTFDTEVCALKDELIQDNLSTEDNMTMIEQSSMEEQGSMQNRTDQHQGRTEQHSGWNETAHRVEPGSIYKKELKKDYNKEVLELGQTTTNSKYPQSFLTLLSTYGTPDFFAEQVHEEWIKLSQREQQDALDCIPFYFLYLDKNNKQKKFLKDYLNSKVFYWQSLEGYKKVQREKEKQELLNKKRQQIWD